MNKSDTLMHAIQNGTYTLRLTWQENTYHGIRFAGQNAGCPTAGQCVACVLLCCCKTEYTYIRCVHAC